MSTNKIIWTLSLQSISGSSVRSLGSADASWLLLLAAVPLLTFAVVVTLVLPLVFSVVSVVVSTSAAQALAADLLRWLNGFKRVRFLAGRWLGATLSTSVALL